MGKGGLRGEGCLRLCLLLLERAGGEWEAVLPPLLLLLLLEEVGRRLGYDRPLVGQVWISWHHRPLGQRVSWIGPPEWPPERRVGAEAWGSLRRLSCTRCKHTVRLSGAGAITWSMHVLREMLGGDAERGTREDNKEALLAVSDGGGGVESGNGRRAPAMA